MIPMRTFASANVAFKRQSAVLSTTNSKSLCTQTAKQSVVSKTGGLSPPVFYKAVIVVTGMRA